MISYFYNHPKGLWVCFFVELWERFSFYGMRALLIFYLTDHLLFSDQKSYMIYGAYTSLVYMTPIIGGLIADQYLGARKAVMLGAILLTMGHFGLAFEGQAAIKVSHDTGSFVQRDTFYLSVFYLSLALIIAGVGFLKSNIAVIVGALYPMEDPRRDAGLC